MEDPTKICDTQRCEQPLIEHRRQNDQPASRNPSFGSGCRLLSVLVSLDAPLMTSLPEQFKTLRQGSDCTHPCPKQFRSKPTMQPAWTVRKRNSMTMQASAQPFRAEPNAPQVAALIRPKPSPRATLAPLSAIATNSTMRSQAWAAAEPLPAQGSPLNSM